MYVYFARTESRQWIGHERDSGVEAGHHGKGNCGDDPGRRFGERPSGSDGELRELLYSIRTTQTVNPVRMH